MFKSEKVDKSGEMHVSSRTSTTTNIVEKSPSPLLLNRKKAKKELSSISDVKNNLGIKKIYQCDECCNSYMHYSALYSHKKTKHNNTPNYNLKKKLKTNGPIPGSILKQKRKQPKKYFFKYTLDINKSGKTSIPEVVSNFSDKLEKIKLFFPQITKLDLSYPLFEKILTSISLLILAKSFIYKQKEKHTCDEIFSIYLQELSNYTNKLYFSRVILPLFISLREYINENGIKYKRIQLEYGIIDSINEKEEYCAVYSAEDVSELCNEFFNYINEKFFYEQLGVYENEFLEEFMNFGSWLFNENYSCCKIFIVDE